MMQIVIHRIIPNSVAEALNLAPGDKILEINHRNNLEDLFDYQFEIMGTETVELKIQRVNSEAETLQVQKKEEEDLGLIFTSPIFTPIKTCNNACPFCFIDQQPEGLRSSLYVKDDDYRLSYFNNTYITLTNLTPHDRQRIEMLRPGPLYVSVHSTVPEIRVKLLVNKKSGNILQELKWLKGLQIPFHCQIVVCPGINDGDSLTQSLEDLSKLRPEALSVAVVPVGLTQYRENLPSLLPVDKACALQLIHRVEAFQKKCKPSGFVYLSDEFYMKAELPLPTYEAYGDFPQLDDGVGTARMLLQSFFDHAPQLPKEVSPAFNLLILTGNYAAMTLTPIVTRLNEIEGLYVDLVGIESKFWGVAVSVAGLITGQDILDTLLPMNLNGYRSAIIPSVMLKQGTDHFLDGNSLGHLEKTLGIPFQVVKDPYSAEELIETIFSEPMPYEPA
jgi:putative radical SAM enzyme (TIGR03279 family)